MARAELLSQQREGATRYPDSVATTWSITINRLRPLARSILKIAAWFAPDEIPRRVLAPDHDIFHHEAGRDVSEIDLELALAELNRFSLVRLAEKTFSIHGLVQTAEQTWLTSEERPKFLEWAFLLLNTFTPDPAEDVPTRDIWVAATPHAESLTVWDKGVSQQFLTGWRSTP